jgi:16S rRNA (guanine(1405)-N(7))-methyltransferase
MSEQEALGEVVAQVRRSARYATISPDLVTRIARQELAIRRNAKEAVKSTRRRLHQAGAVYLGATPPYERLLAALHGAQSDPARVRQVCREALAAHQSSRERLPILEHFYREVLGDLAPVASVLDLACGLNPLAIPWMPLAPGAQYAACDIYTDLAAFLQEALSLLGVAGHADTVDLSAQTPEIVADVAFLLKTIPCLEQLDREAGARLLREVRARHVVVSFPLQSLGGRRDRGMPANYRARFDEIVANQPWEIIEYCFESELVFVVDKGADAPQ